MLLTGPLGSGKTHFVLAELEEAVRQGRASEVKLVVPTASMAEHLLHTLARRGLAVSGDLILTIRDFVARLTPDSCEALPAVEARLLKQAIALARRDEFGDLAHTPGLQGKLMAAIQEFQAAGCPAGTAGKLLRKPYQAAFAGVFQAYEELLEENGYVHPAQRFRQAAEEVRNRGLGGIHDIYFDGFVNFSVAERQFIAAIQEKAKRLVVTLPEFAEQPEAGDFVPEMPRRSLKTTYRRPVSPATVRATTPEHEIEKAAHEIVTGNRPFRDYGLIVRAPEAYAPVIRIVFERFGIPFRMRWPTPLRRHGAVSYLVRLLEAVADGFPAEKTLEVLNTCWCPIGVVPQMERFDFLVRESLPGSGLKFLRRQAEGLKQVSRFLKELSALEDWAREGSSAAPRVWAARTRGLASKWLRWPSAGDGIAMHRVLELRTLALACSQFDDAAEEAAKLIEMESEGRITLAAYLAALEDVLQEDILRAPDQRRNVVNVLTIFEARQWELPVVFVCGLVEGQFPRRPPQDLLFPDADRQRLRSEGVRLRTSAELGREERVLFEMAVSRATERLVLTYPQFDEDGRPVLRSSFLDWPKEGDGKASAVRVREEPPLFREQRPDHLTSRELLDEVVARHEHFSPTSIETCLQCPYQFFARSTLRLRERPASPEERLDPSLMGTIVHQCIAQWRGQSSKSIGEIFEPVFEQQCEEHSIQGNFRTAIIRANLQADLERFVTNEAARKFAGCSKQESEERISYLLDETEELPLKISGRIDRYDVFDGQFGVVVDYKYSKRDRVKRLFYGHLDGARVQGPLYLLGLERVHGLRPGGVLFWGLRGELSLYGWVLKDLLPQSIFDQYKKNVKRLNEAALGGILRNCEEQTIETVGEIRSGRIAVDPKDRDVCHTYCEFRDVCRIEL